MRLSRLELKGFKSFKEKTILQFPDKFMGIVGPNGSGKSNITESICFVLGKSRGLRAQNLSELIFNGGIGGEPANKAVVSLTLVDDDGRKHKVTRIIERDGTSVYKLDDKRSTRSKILEIVGDSEYNILLQSDITKAVEMKPQDRRKVIDDLCGIGQYDEKRDKAIRELDKVEERISQTSLILGQKAGYLTSLKSERDEAIRYTNARQSLRECQATLIHKEISSLERREEKILELTGEIEKNHLEGHKQIESIQKNIEEGRELFRSLRTDIVRLEKERRGTKMAEVQGEILRIGDRITFIGEQLATYERESKTKKESIDSLQSQKRALDEELVQKASQMTVIEKEIDFESTKGVDHSLESEVDEVKSSLYDFRSKINALRGLVGEKTKERDGIAQDVALIEGKLKTGVGDEQNKVKNFESLNMNYEKAVSDFKKFEREYNELNECVNLMGERLQNQRLELTKKKSSLEAINRASGGLQHAVRAVIELKKAIPGIYGPVMQLAQLEDDDFKQALSAASGARMQYVVVSSVNDAKRCIEYLRNKQIGRCTFLPLDKIRSNVSNEAPVLSMGFARDMIKFSPQYKAVFDYVFGDTLVVKDIDVAKKIGIGSWRMVTLDGDLLELSGAMTGGHRSNRSDITFTNVDEMEGEIVSLEASVHSLEAEYNNLLDKRRGKDSLLNTLRDRMRVSKDELSELRADKDIATERRSSLRENLNKGQVTLKRLENEIRDASVEITTCEKHASSLEKKLEELRSQDDNAAKSKLEGLKDKLRDLEVSSSRLNEKTSSINEKLSDLMQRIGELDGLIDGAKKEIEDLNKRRTDYQSSLEGLEKAHESVGSQIDILTKKREETELSLVTFSQKIAEIQQTIESSKDRLSDFLIEKAKITQRLEDLRRSFSKFEGVNILDKPVKELEDEAEKLEEKITNFGSVNMRAVDTYDVIVKEYEEITQKLETLKSERVSISDFMEKIESKKRETFMNAFDKVKDNFERIFAELSDGRGTLIINDPLNISEAGLLIKASPGGKKLMSLEQMSGGEKVLTSTAFLLALQQYKPAYFYVVDELDAALDHRNSIRLAQMLAGNKSQFLMVTHNNNMLKYMNSALGVSMVKGASKIVGVRFSDESNPEAVYSE